MISQTETLDLAEMLTFNLSSIPHALGNHDGSLSKTNKAELTKLIVKKVPSIITSRETSLESDTLIIDGMVLLRQLNRSQIPDTFGGLSSFVLDCVRRKAESVKATCVHLVWDTYPDVSIKSGEQSRRQAALGTSVFHLSGDGQKQKVPRNFAQFLSNGKNKNSLIGFLFNCWKSDVSKMGGITLFFAHAKVCHKLKHENLGGSTDSDELSSLCTHDMAGRNTSVTVVPELACDHQEADTRMLLHTAHAARTSSSVTIFSPDTDVFLLALSCVHSLESTALYVLASQGTVYDMNTVKDSFTEKECNALLGLHSFSGCDSVSSFRNKGKKSVLQVLTKYPEFLSCFADLGQTWTPSSELCKDLERFVCRLYGSEETSINAVRLALFKKKKANEYILPPTEDSLDLHTKRAAYQTAIWRRCGEQEIKPPPPEEHGWTMTEGSGLEPQWSLKPTMPPAVTQFVQCGCKLSRCIDNHCMCRRKERVCTDICECANCENNLKQTATTDFSSDSELELSESDNDSDIDV